MGNFFEDEEFNKIDFTVKGFPKGEYENCTFINCNFDSLHLSTNSFSECEFIGCNLSSAKLANTSLKDVHFKDCKLLGLHFFECNPFLFEVSFNKCVLNLSSFYKLPLKKVKIRDCSLQEVDFSESDLSQTVFDNCDFKGAIFDNTNLEKADFRTSFNFVLSPERNKIKKARFSKEGALGLLLQYDILIE